MEMRDLSKKNALLNLEQMETKQRSAGQSV